jgi:acetyl-CoA carboxylase carboxyl transferase subunit beta
MGWFTKNPKKTPEKKEQLWVICPSCKDHVFKEEWQKALKVCAKCKYHERLNYQERIELIADDGSFQEINGDVTFSDPLKFADNSGTYKQKAEEAKTKTGMKEAVVTGTAAVGGVPICLAIMDFRFLGGSLGSGTGEKILLAAEHALQNRMPYVVFSASGGARMHEGIISLMQMAKTCAAIARLSKGRIPYISVLTDPTYGGVSASYATVGDLNIAEPGALIGFAGRRVIEQTIKQKLPEDFQTAEYLLKHGFIDSIVNRSEMKDFLRRVLLYWHAK